MYYLIIKNNLLNYSESFLSYYLHNFLNYYYAALFNDQAIFCNRVSNDQHPYDDAYLRDQSFLLQENTDLSLHFIRWPYRLILKI